MALFLHSFNLLIFQFFNFSIFQNGPLPKQLVVPIAVKNAVSAATITFTASSITLCFFILGFFLPRKNTDEHRVFC